jgi:hypothetical protein
MKYSKKPRPMHRWEGNVKTDLREVKWGGGGRGAKTGSIWLRIRAGGRLL